MFGRRLSLARGALVADPKGGVVGAVKDKLLGGAVTQKSSEVNKLVGSGALA